MARKSIDVEELLRWAYRDQRVGKVIGRGTGMHPLERQMAGQEVSLPSGDGCWRVGQIMALGRSVQSSGAAWGGSAEVDEDAEVVHATVMSLDRKTRALVVNHAEFGSRPPIDPPERPKWVGPGRPWWAPTYGWSTDGAGRRKPAEYVFDASAGMGRQPSHCEIVLCGGEAEVRALRDVYAAWREVLCVLAGHFRSHPQLLRRFAVTGPAAPVEPWRTNGG